MVDSKDITINNLPIKIEEAEEIPQGWAAAKKKDVDVESDDEAKKAKAEKKAAEDLNKSYESMGSKEEEAPHYNYDSDGEPPTDAVGDILTIVKKKQVVKRILEVGADLGKPGRPFVVTVSYKGYFAKEKDSKYSKDDMSCEPGEVFVD
eukprot:CAMPEP_0176358296 /NCGR_PEP_ID=MMETSP0126-20121128/15446_1 /TAXON_ID=141414 ORGANISM="Strombidinopsis acuminatum, Strain SPMC142" /NCGR_SAMPLE_ID=MMETSP0126 /ASSEMBLY_ACC=CAM_ASM_000229 /LENGTH=148 /DNA_ID=CAMNT_0017712391 /DNA_START=34 /DNA_END=480 /DNA_ORIENTATION=+